MEDSPEVRYFSEQIADRLRSMTLSYYRFITVASREAGLSITEFMALGYLRDRGSLRAGQWGERLGLTSASITALIDRLERIGYAHRRPHPTDRHSILVERDRSRCPNAHRTFEERSG